MTINQMRNIFVFCCVMVILSMAQAQSPSPSFNSEAWNKVQLEEWLGYQITDAGQRVVPKENFHVVTRIVLAQTPLKTHYSEPRSIAIDKFGLNLNLPGVGSKAPSVSKDFFKRIESIDIQVSVADNVSPEQKAVLREIPFKVVTFVQAGQLNVKVESVPGWQTSSLGRWLREYQLVFGLCALAFAVALFGWFFLRTVRETGKGISHTISEVAIKVTESRHSEEQSTWHSAKVKSQEAGPRPQHQPPATKPTTPTKHVTQTPTPATVKKEFPSHLVWKLPPEVLKEALMNIEMENLIQFSAGMASKEQGAFNKALDQLGDKVSSYVRLESQMIREDVKRRSQAESQHLSLFAHFVDAVRVYLSTNESAQKAANHVMDEWERSEGRKKKDAA